MRKLKRLSKNMALAGAFALLAACSSPKETPLPKSFQDEQAMAQLRGALEKLSPEDRELVGRYVVRQTMAEALAPVFGLAPEPRPEGMTVGRAIEDQKAFEAKQKAKAKQEALLAEIKKTEQAKADQTRSAMEEKIKTLLEVRLEGVELRKANPRLGEFRDQLLISLSLANRGGKGVAAVKGRLVFKDSFGDVIYKVNMKTENAVAPGASESIVLGGRYNQFDDADVALARASSGALSLSFTPIAIVFADGSLLETTPPLD